MFTHVAAASVLAGVAVTLVGLQLTVGASKAGPAVASETALACVGAGCTISAWFVVGAVVQVLVAEEAPPALLTVTLPWLAACPVETAWVADAFIAGRALPAHAARTAPRGLAVAMPLTAFRRADGWRGEGGAVCDYNGHAFSYISHTNTERLMSDPSHVPDVTIG